MSKRESIARYSLIIKKLRKKPATFSEISDYLQRESELQDYNFNISKRTFQRDVEDIRSLYNIEIRYDFSKKVYLIDSEMKQEANERIFEAFDTFSMMKMEERLSDFLFFENRGSKGTEHLLGLMHAIKNRYKASFIYSKFWDDEITLRTSEPLALKEFKNRWYLIAKDCNDKTIKSFGLDRMEDLDIKNEKFLEEDNFNVKEYYKYCYGIIGPNANAPSEIKLSFDPNFGNYIKTMPLHHSQQIITDSDEELIVKLKLFLTIDFITEILSYGNNVKVLAPDELIDIIKKELKVNLKLYN